MFAHFARHGLDESHWFYSAHSFVGFCGLPYGKAWLIDLIDLIDCMECTRPIVDEGEGLGKGLPYDVAGFPGFEEFGV
jgi:hypothetical protein